MQRKEAPLPPFPRPLKQAARASLELAADWAVRNQVRDTWPFWDANKGRFPYHVRIDPRKRALEPPMWSTCWKTSRTAQGLFDAYLVTGNPAFLDAANLALDYVSTLQIFEPGYEKWHGSFREDSPQGPHVALRDGMEAVQAFTAGYLVTGHERYLRRALAGADFFVRQFHKDHFSFSIAFPFSANKKTPIGTYFFFCAGAIPCAQLAAITGKKDYISKGAAPMMDHIIAHHILDNGALGIKGESAISHHTSMPGQYANVVSNDDGIGSAMLCTYRATGREKYLKAAVGMGDFWVNSGIDPATLASFSSVSLFLSDLYRITADRRYRPVIERFTRKTLELQYLDKKQPVLHGAYIGEDMAKHYDKKSKPTDWVDLRITSYSLIALSKVAANRPNQWGAAYSCFGW